MRGAGGRPLPDAIARAAAGYEVSPVTLGRSGAAVLRLTAPGAPPLFLKSASGPLAADVAGEAARLRWLAGRAPCPAVLAAAEEGGSAFLLMSAVPGVDTSDRAYAGGVPAMVRGLAEGLRALHAAPADGCPFDHRLASEVARARARLAAGACDLGRLAALRPGVGPAQLLAELLDAHGPGEEPVLTHGDACLPNVLLDGGRLAGFCDLGRAGLGDRYRDLALAARSLAYNWGAEHVPLLFEAYGLLAPDQGKIDCYLILDEYF